MNIAMGEIDITPPLGTRKIGWLKMLVAEHIHDQQPTRAGSG